MVWETQRPLSHHCTSLFLLSLQNGEAVGTRRNYQACRRGKVHIIPISLFATAWQEMTDIDMTSYLSTLSRGIPHSLFISFHSSLFMSLVINRVELSYIGCHEPLPCSLNLMSSFLMDGWMGILAKLFSFWSIMVVLCYPTVIS